jgi:NADPH-dependent curcumin reductase CurA
VINKKVVLAGRPNGTPQPSDFKVIEEDVGELPDGQVRLQVEYLSIDAFIRTMLDDRDDSHHGSMEIDTPVIALGTARVVESKFDGLNQGDAVFGPMGAQTIVQLPGEMYRKLDDSEVPARTYLGALGMTTGLTAYAGMITVGEVQAGDTVVVSAAGGAVGSIACQIAKIKGATVIGIAGGKEKCEFLTGDVGCDFAIDYKGDDIDAKLKEYAPEGVSVFFDNVGGELLDLVLDNLKMGARVVICGAISQYDHLTKVRGPALYLRVAERNASMRGFTVDHFMTSFPAMEADLSGWLKDGTLHMPEHIEEGIESFPKALSMLFDGGNKGKLLVKP